MRSVESVVEGARRVSRVRDKVRHTVDWIGCSWGESVEIENAGTNPPTRSDLQTTS